MKMIKATLTFIPTTGDAMSDTLRKATAAAGKTLLTVSLCLACFGLAAHSSLAAGAGLKTLSGHVPQVVANLSALGSLPATNTLQLAIGLPLRNPEELTNLLEQMYDPASTNYHQFLTPEEFAAQFGPSEQDYQAVVDFAKANGLVVTAVHPNRMLLGVSGKAGDIEKAFHINMRIYRHPKEARNFFAPDAEPSVPSGLAIQDVGGLDNLRQPHAYYRFKPARALPNTALNAAPNAGRGPGGSYMGNDFRNAYVPGSTLNGLGQTVALVQFDGYFTNDIVAYESMAGRTNVPLQNVLLDGFNGVPTGDGGEVEVSLDIEMAISMAPALAKVIVYEGNPFNFFPNDVLNRIATDNSAKQISCSWGWTGGPSATTDQIFQQMALQGQSFFTASGDGDAYPAGTVDNPFNFGTPADSPYLTSVGGTTLTMSGAGVAYTSETVWNWGIEFGDDGVGSSGGYSSVYSIPSWQTNVSMTANKGSTTTRNFPDVALTADNVFVIADGGVFYPGVGGTSCAAPLWAGFTALINQQGVINGKPSVGFLNPALYSIAKGANYATCFHDITTGNNTWSGSPTLFFAVTNYDLCTGLGTPNGTNLINALVGAGSGTNAFTHLSPPPPPYGSTLSVLNGGNPNGTWQLFVLDNVQLDSGTNYNGWYLTLAMANPVGAVCDLALSMTASPASTVVVGNNLVYVIGVTNYGVSTATNALITDTLPAGVTVVSTTGSATRNGFNLIWNLGNLASGVGTSITLTVRPTAAGTINNYAIANSATPDPNPADDSALVSVTATATSAPPQIGSFGRNNGNFQLTITAPSVPTIVQVSTNLATTNWLNVYTSTPPFTFTETNATNPARFYRALSAP